MNTATNTQQLDWTPAQTLEHFQKQINLPVLHEMLTTFFKAKASEKGDQLLRRPPIAVRLLDGDEHVYTIRPGWTKPCRTYLTHEQVYGRFSYESLFVDAIHQCHGKCAKFTFDDTSIRMTSWYRSRYFEAVENFAQTAKDFVLFPWQVFSRSKDRCCICHKRLTDEISRGRGIGPECLRHVSNCFGQPVGGSR
jgi:hypothetical protein